MSHEAPKFPLSEKVLKAFPPDQTTLFDWLRERTTDKMLKVISRCDNESEAEEHLAALRGIRDTGDASNAGEWVPGEVLALYRWSEYKPEKPAGLFNFLFKPAEQVQELTDPREFHIARAFCACAMLVGPEQKDQMNLEACNVDALLALILSCHELGLEPLNYLARLIVHGIDQMESWHSPFLFYGCALIANLRWLGEPTEEVRTWFDRASREILPWHREPLFGNRTPKNFLGINFATIQRKHWTKLAREAGVIVS